MNATATESIPRPGAGLLALEQRAAWELGAFLAASPLLRSLGRGDEHPVLVLPGFTAGDRSTGPLRSVLRSQGYWAHGWGLGRNLGPTPEIVEGIGARLIEVFERHERKVTIIGWSLGGMYARGMARMAPDVVRQVITLGSPFRMRQRDANASNVSLLFNRVRSRHVEAPPEASIPEHELPPLPVPTTAIYSRTDGVVHWSACIEAEGPFRENIEVEGSHSGLGLNPAVLYAISDRLAQPENDWRPFSAPALLRRFYPRPTWWLPASER